MLNSGMVAWLVRAPVARGHATMNQRENPLFWSFSLGNWFATDVRVSWYLPVLWVVFVFQFGWAYGTAVEAILFLSILLHEFGHVFAARATGGQADEILMWPLGGLAFTQPARTFKSQFLTSACGPLVNVLLCVVTFLFIWKSQYASSLWAFVLPIPIETFGTQLPLELAVLTFSLNWMGLLLNLIPAYPLDGGQMLRAWLVNQKGNLAGSELALKIGMFAGIGLFFVGFIHKDFAWLFGLSLFLFLMAYMELQHVRIVEYQEETVFGYDFSQGYTSLERSMPQEEGPRLSMWQRWKQQREAEARRREAEHEQEAEARLDSLLAKIKEQGMSALSPAEKQMLETASAKIRKGRTGP
ncbi:MAG: peptidase [Planctomycetaceae bacterium]|nr:peptidase [Planctomycetaceae bacterium]